MYKKVFAKATLNIIRETAKAKSIFYNSAVFLSKSICLQKP